MFASLSQIFLLSAFFVVSHPMTGTSGTRLRAASMVVHPLGGDCSFPPVLTQTESCGGVSVPCPEQCNVVRGKSLRMIHAP